MGMRKLPLWGAKFGAKVLNRGLAFFITREFGGKGRCISAVPNALCLTNVSTAMGVALSVTSTQMASVCSEERNPMKI